MIDLSHAEKKLAGRSLVNLLMERRRRGALSARRLVLALATLLVGRTVYRSQASEP
jgi:hypothetical protein